MDYEFIIFIFTILAQALYLAFKIGKFDEKLTTIEKKQDKHNNLIERVYHLEESVKSAHKRLDEIKSLN